MVEKPISKQQDDQMNIENFNFDAISQTIKNHAQLWRCILFNI